MPARRERKSFVIARETRALSELGRRHISWPIALVALVSLCAFALDHHSATAQGAHKDSPSGTQQVMSQSWSVQQSAPAFIQTVAQTADGFLWLDGPGGVFRFDGTRFERFHRPRMIDCFTRMCILCSHLGMAAFGWDT